MPTLTKCKRCGEFRRDKCHCTAWTVWMEDEEHQDAIDVWHLWEDDAAMKFVEEWDFDEPSVWKHSVRVLIHPIGKPEETHIYCIEAEIVMQYTATKINKPQ